MKKIWNMICHRQVHYRALKSLMMLITVVFYFYFMSFTKHTIIVATIAFIICIIQIYLIDYVFYLLDEHYQ